MRLEIILCFGLIENNRKIIRNMLKTIRQEKI